MNKRKMSQKEKEEQDEKKLVTLPPLPVNEERPVPMEISGTDPKLLMRVVTWQRDSHGLFDYESRQIQKKNIKIDRWD